MSIVNIRNVEFLNSAARWDDEYRLRITFDCVEQLQDVIEWKLVYVGDAKTEQYDQELDACEVGPVPVGVNLFEFDAQPPQPHLLPSQKSEDVLGVTVIFLVGLYREREFVRVGYYVNIEYEDKEVQENPPEIVDFKGLVRSVLADKPRVTKTLCPWDAEFKSPFNQSSQQPLTDRAENGHQDAYSYTNGADVNDASKLSGAGAGNSDNLYNSPMPQPVASSMTSAPQQADVDMS